MKTGDKIFVYGTLRPDARNGKMMTTGAKHVGTDSITGAQLYNLGWFPGVKLDKTDSMVHGDVFEIVDGKLPPRLDSYEGYPSLYSRSQVKTDNGELAWVYTYNGSVSQDQLIESGEWCPREHGGFAG